MHRPACESSQSGQGLRMHTIVRPARLNPEYIAYVCTSECASAASLYRVVRWPTLHAPVICSYTANNFDAKVGYRLSKAYCACTSLRLKFHGPITSIKCSWSAYFTWVLDELKTGRWRLQTKFKLHTSQTISHCSYCVVPSQFLLHTLLVILHSK